MFSKRNCARCGRKINGNYDFCPHCGNILKSQKEKFEDYGMLGKDDLLENDRNPFQSEIRLPPGFNAIFNSLMKNFEKQMHELERESIIEDDDSKKLSKSRFGHGGSIKINIASFGNQPPKISVSTSGDFAQNKSKSNKVVQPLKFKNNFDEEKIKRLQTLPRLEPKSSIKRIENSVIYEIDLPDVSSLEDVLINQLESSIEIKAVGKNNSYSKVIPVKLPIIGHQFTKGKLILEMQQ